MSSKPLDPEIQVAAAAIQLSIVIATTLKPAELGNDMYQLVYDTWIRHGRAPEWISEAVDAIDDIKRISITRVAFAKKKVEWALAVEWIDE